jgi:CubicO group peptidase (beta-lactamase class C family)
MKRLVICSAVTLLLVSQGWVTPSLVSAQAHSLTDDPRVASALELIEIWMEAEVDYEDLPGVSMGVVAGQDLIWSQGFGYADVESRRPAAPDTIYSICSISKLFTSISVMQLRDAGNLDLDDPVGEILPWFDIQNTFPEGPAITVRRLLTHSSGLPREAGYPYWTGPEYPFPTHEQIVERLSEQETLYPSAEYFQYSNLGLTLAGEIVAAASGQPYAEYVRQHILDPLGLESTTPEIPDDQRGKRLATGYTSKLRDGSRKVVPDYLVRGIAPAAGFTSTVEDLARFAAWQFRLLEDGGDEVLSVNTLREMQRVHWIDPDWETTWGLGFSVSRRDDKTFVGHGGSCPGYRTQLLMSPKDRVAVVFMTNGQGTNTGMYANRTFDAVAPAIVAALETPSEGDAPNPAFEKYVGRYERPLGGESYVLPWKGSLAVLSLPSSDPIGSLTRLQHVGEDTFRRIREDDELGEEIFFEVDADGAVIRMWRHNNPSYRVR